MAEVLLPWTVPDQEAGTVVGLIWDDALNQILGFYGQNSSEDQITLKVQVGAAVRSITLAPFETVERRVTLPTAQRIAMRLATGTDRPWQQQRGFVPSYTSLTVERVFTTPRGGSPSILSAAYTEFLSSATTSHATPMPATVDPNDGLLVGFFIDITANLWATGFSKITDATNTDRGFTFGKVAVGNEDGTNIDFLSTSAALGIAHVYRIDAGTWGECVAAFEGATATGTSATPDPPSITPSWGSQDITVVAFGMKISGTVTSAPTNYTDLVNGAAGANMGSARRSLTASSEDPGTFGGATSDAWNAHTIAIAPEDADLTNSGKPYFVGCGTSVSGAAGITATLPGGILNDDLLILVLESEGEDTNPETLPTGWADPGDNSTASGTGGAAADVRITWGTDIYDSGSPPTLTVADAGDHVTAVIYAFRNVNTTTPIDAIQASANGTAGTSMSITGLNSNQDDCLVFQVSAAGDDSGVASPVTMSGTNANLAAPAIRHAGGGATTAGSDGSIQAFYGGLAAAGASGTATGTFSASVEQANYTIIIAPPPAATPATVTPAATARSFTVDAASARGAALTAPAATARSFTVDAVTIHGAANTTFSAIARSFALDQVTVDDGTTPATVAPDPIARAVAIGASTQVGGAVVQMGATAYVVVMPQAQAKSPITAAPDTTVRSVVIPAVTVQGGSVVNTGINVTIVMPASTIRSGVVLVLDEIDMTVVASQPVVFAGEADTSDRFVDTVWTDPT